MTQETIIENIATREQLINRVEVLDKVKELLLIPRMQFTTTQGVADFYEVTPKAISSIVNRHRIELDEDGLTKVSRKDALARLIQNEEGVRCDEDVLYTETKQFVEVFLSDKYSVKISNGPTLVFPKRAVLRIGMLLRDSEVAKEVRTQLLNIEEATSEEVKVVEIDKEMELLEKAVGAAFLNNNVEEFIAAMQEIQKYNNRYSAEAYKALEEENAELKESIYEMGLIIENLKLSNEAMAEEISTIATVEVYRRVIITMMTRLAEKKRYTSPYLCYQQLYAILRNDYEIDLTGRRYSLTVNERKQKSKIDCLETMEEWNIATKVGTAMCYKANVDIDDLLYQIKEYGEQSK